MFHLSGHDYLLDILLLKEANQLSQLTQAQPVKRHLGLGSKIFDFRRGFLANGGHHHGDVSFQGFFQNQERESAISGYEPQFGNVHLSLPTSRTNPLLELSTN